MEAVDEEGEQYLEEELLSDKEEATNAKEYDAIESTIPTPEEPTTTKYDNLTMNMKELKAKLKKTKPKY